MRPDLAKWASPTTYVNEKTPPFIIMHGSKDQIVPDSQSVHFQNVLMEAGHQPEFFIEEGAKHGDEVFDTEKYVSKVEAFLDRHIN